MRPVSTFSIVARDPETGDLGVAVASKFLAVGSVVPYAVAGIGAIATQSYANTTFGPRAIDALRAGIPLELIQRAFATTDPEHDERQYGMVDAGGRALTFTGASCQPWAGGASSDGVAAQGNLLAGPEVVDALVRGFAAASGGLPRRLLAALAAGDAAGGDRRGRQGAALLVVRDGGGYAGFNDRWIDLRVDDDGAPVARLERLLELHELYFDLPDEDDLLALDGDVGARVLAVLERSGRHPSGEGWSDAAVAALRDLAGVENLEEHLRPGPTADGGLRIGRRALRHLERVYPPA